MGHDGYWRTENRHPLGDPLQAKTRGYFEHFYPYDERSEKPTPREKPRPLALGLGVLLSSGREPVADALSEKAANANIPDAVRGLQKTLNKRGYSNQNQQLPHLKEDGDFGPRTYARLDEELLRGGPISVIRDLDYMSVA
jgi:hypothetical protein